MSDEYLNAWGEIFVKHGLYRRLGVRFERFIQAPRHYLRLAPGRPIGTRDSDRRHCQPPYLSGPAADARRHYLRAALRASP